MKSDIYIFKYQKKKWNLKNTTIQRRTKISDFWIKKGLFKPTKSKSNKKFSMLIPPPNTLEDYIWATL